MKRRRYDAHFKFEVVMTALKSQQSAAEVCERYGISGSLLSRWKHEFMQKGATIFSDQPEAEQLIVRLEQTIDQLTMELEILKKTAASTNLV